MNKRIFLYIISIQMIVLSIVPTYATNKETSYNYDYWANPVETPSAYTYFTSYDVNELKEDSLKKPSDMVIDKNGYIYVADTGNNRVVVLDKNGNVKKSVSTFKNEDKDDSLLAPEGIAVSEKGEIYVADTGNKRIVRFDKDWNMDYIYQDIKADYIPEDFELVPMRLVVDKLDRTYVIAKNAVEGLMTFEHDGTFSGYFGTIPIKVNFIDYLWKLAATKEQKSKMEMFVPTEFTGLDIDEDGFIYTSDIDYKSHQNIKKLNPSGKDVLVNYSEHFIVGDLDYPLTGENSGPSRLSDIKYRKNGIYSTLDMKRGRIFTYDNEGNLLYIFGNIGDTVSTFKLPVAIESHESNIYILDKNRNSIDIFEETEYGHLINTAVELRYNGDEGEAVKYWEEVLKLDANYDMANRGIGKAYLADKDNEKAAEYLKAGMDKRYYSVAYRRLRNEQLREIMPKMLNVIGVAVLLTIVYKIFKKRKRREI